MISDTRQVVWHSQIFYVPENKGLVIANRKICTALSKTGAFNQNTSLAIIKYLWCIFAYECFLLVSLNSIVFGIQEFRQAKICDYSRHEFLLYCSRDLVFMSVLRLRIFSWLLGTANSIVVVLVLTPVTVTTKDLSGRHCFHTYAIFLGLSKQEINY